MTLLQMYSQKVHDMHCKLHYFMSTGFITTKHVANKLSTFDSHNFHLIGDRFWN